MNISDKDKRTLTIGGVLAAVIVFVGFIVMPLVNKYSDMQSELGPKQSLVDTLKDRVHGPDSVLVQRNTLARRLGVLAGVPAPTSNEKPTVPKQDKEPASEDSDTEDKGQQPLAASVSVEDKGQLPLASSTSAVASNAEASPSEDDKEPGPKDSDEAASSDEPSIHEDDEEPAAKDSDEAASGAKSSELKQDDAVSGEKPDAAVAKEGAAPAKPVDDVRLSVQLERIAGKSGMKIKRLVPKTRRSGSGKYKHFTREVLQVSVEGSTENFMKMLHAIEKGGRFMRIESVQIRRDIAKGSQLNVTLDVMGYDNKVR